MQPARLIVAATLTFAAGVALGVAGRALDHLPGGIGAAPSAIGGPWLVAAFLVACVTAWLAGPRAARVCGPLSGAAVLAIGSASYYYVFHFVEGTAGLRYAVAMGFSWALAGVVIGVGIGALAARTLLGWAAARAALLSLGGLLAGEALALLAIWRADDLQAVALGQLLGAGALVLAALALPLRDGRRRLTIAPVVPAAALAGAIGAVIVRETLRAAGWAGA